MLGSFKWWIWYGIRPLKLRNCQHDVCCTFQVYLYIILYVHPTYISVVLLRLIFGFLILHLSLQVNLEYLSKPPSQPVSWKKLLMALWQYDHYHWVELYMTGLANFLLIRTVYVDSFLIFNAILLPWAWFMTGWKTRSSFLWYNDIRYSSSSRNCCSSHISSTEQIQGIDKLVLQIAFLSINNLALSYYELHFSCLGSWLFTLCLGLQSSASIFWARRNGSPRAVLTGFPYFAIKQ